MKKFLVWFKVTFGDTWLANFIQKIVSSADNTNSGFVGKKMTIIALIFCVIKMHQAWLMYALSKGDFSLFPIILGSDFTTILALFGINEYAKKKNSTMQTEQTDTTSATDNSTTTQTDTTTTQSTN